MYSRTWHQFLSVILGLGLSLGCGTSRAPEASAGPAASSSNETPLVMEKLRFDWPIPSSATVRWKFSNRDSPEIEASFKLDVVKPDGEPLQMRTSELQFLSVAGQALTPEEQKFLLAKSSGQVLDGMALELRGDGTSVGLLDFEASLQAAMKAAGVTDEAVIAKFREPAFRTAFESSAAQWWTLWAQGWIGFEQTSVGQSVYDVEMPAATGQLVPYELTESLIGPSPLASGYVRIRTETTVDEKRALPIIKAAAEELAGNGAEVSLEKYEHSIVSTADLHPSTMRPLRVESRIRRVIGAQGQPPRIDDKHQVFEFSWND